MANRVGSVIAFPLAPIDVEPTIVPEVIESGAVNITVTVVTVKSGGGIQTTKID